MWRRSYLTNTDYYHVVVFQSILYVVGSAEQTERTARIPSTDGSVNDYDIHDLRYVHLGYVLLLTCMYTITRAQGTDRLDEGVHGMPSQVGRNGSQGKG